MRKAMLVAALVMGTAAAAKDAPKTGTTAKEAADRFSLDLPPSEGYPAVSAEQPAAGVLTLDTPIADLIADPRGKRVLDRDLPGLSRDKNLDKFKALSLRRLAPLSGGRLTPTLLETVGKHLAETG